MKNFLFLFYLTTFYFTLFSCGQTQRTGDANTLVIGAMSSMDFLPVAVAKEKELFTKYGIQVEIEKFYSANERDAAFHTGNTDGTVIDYTGAVLQKSGGIKLKLVSACDAPFGIVASPFSNVQSISGLQGKKVAVSRNTVIDFCMDAALTTAGLTDTDVKKTEINKIPLRYEMLMQGEIDATVLPDPFLTRALLNKGILLTDMERLGYQITGIVFHEKSLREKSEAIRYFYQAYNEAVDYINHHTIEDIKVNLIRDAGFPEEMLPYITLPAYKYAALPDTKDIQATVEWLKNRKLIDGNFDVDNFMDTRFAAKRD